MRKTGVLVANKVQRVLCFKVGENRFDRHFLQSCETIITKCPKSWESGPIIDDDVVAGCIAAHVHHIAAANPEVLRNCLPQRLAYRDLELIPKLEIVLSLNFVQRRIKVS